MWSPFIFCSGEKLECQSPEEDVLGIAGFTPLKVQKEGLSEFALLDARAFEEEHLRSS